MADDILEQEAGACQSDSQNSTAGSNKTTEPSVFNPVFESMTFSLTFTASQWCLFWRLMHVGCMLSDQMQECARRRITITDTSSSLLWDALSSELASVLKEQVEKRKS